MAIAFTTAPTVEPEDAITSTQLSALADAFNSRLRSGIADGTFRIHQFLFNSFRSVRYPDGTAFPSWAEFFEFYMHVDPDETPATWPLSMPNAASGANQASQMMAFVFGDLSVDPEGYRLVENFPLWAGGNPPTTPELQWIVGNRQRGAIDPDTGNQYVPAYQAAQEYFKITQLPDSFHGKSYGSFQPQAETIGDCGRNVVNRRIFYTSVVATPDTSGILNGTISTADGNTVVTYDGTCFNGTPNAQPTHVQYVSETPFAHYIFLNDGGIDRVPINDFIEGPYTQGGELKKPNGNQLTNYLNAFIHDFRGTHDERYPDNAAQQDTKDIGFSFEEFLAQQYFLSPNIGTTSGSAINPVYPQFAWIGIAEPPENDLAIHSQSATTAHQYADGFTLAVAYVQYERLSEAATVQCLVNGDVYKSFTVPEDDGEFMVTFKDVVNTPEISFRLPDGATFTDSSGYIMVDCTEQVYYRPQLHDAYLLLRLMSTEGDEDARVEGRGLDDDRANEFYERYMLTGMCKNTVAQAPVIQDVEVNNNPVYDAARRLCRENVKIVPRRELLNYEVSGGKSILYFQRHALGLSNQNVDSFKGLAPSLENITSGGITTGQSYQLRTGSIDYSGTTYNAGDIFTGAGGVKAFTDNETQTASVVREYEGVRPLAFPNGYSNEWLMFSQEKVYSHSDSNIFHPDSYSDIMAFNNRCMFYAPTHELGPNGSSGDILRHVQTGITVPVLAPEAPSGYNYLRNINEFTYTADDTKTNFYKSCPIYKPDEEIESCISYEEGGIEVVKLTFTGRIQHTDEAPATISSNHLVWDKDALALEPYRTTENAIREYIIARGGTQHCTTSMVGNTAAESTVPRSKFC